MDQKPYIPYLEIPGQLQLRDGDVLVVASDITRLAMNAIRRENGFDISKFIDILQQEAGENGTLIIPAFNFNLYSGQSFDANKTLPVTGALALAAAKRDDFARTWNPLHSFYVWGKYADKLCRLRNESSFGKDSPFAFFREMDARMLFIDTDVAEALTYTHFVEELEKVPYRKFVKLKIKYKDHEGFEKDVIIRFYRKKYGWTMKLDRLQELLREDYILRKNINGVNFSILPLDKVHGTILNDIRNNRARSIAGFSCMRYIRDLIKSTLRPFGIKLTTQDRIKYAAGIF